MQMEGLNEMPIDWELLLEKQSPENAMSMLKQELGPSILGIMESIIFQLEQRRFLALRSTVIRLIDYFSNFEATPCVRSLILIKEDLLQLDCFEECTLKCLISGIQTLFLNMSYLLYYLQEAFLVYPEEQEENQLNQKMKEFDQKLLVVQNQERIQQFSPKNWKESLIF
ncbi:hypothetical protein ABPG74_002173 [Tetrahymena malaccensis]